MTSKTFARPARATKLLAGAAGLALMMGASGAVAQNTARDEAAVGEVVVTAQRRAERLQDVPVAVSAFTGDQLARLGVEGTKDLTAITPGLNFTQSIYSPQPTIRGIGLRGVGAGDESVVPMYVDGVYQAFIAAADLQFTDVERIEVLKGPQSTLFGRNAVGGAINIVTRTPTEEPSGKLSVSYGRFDQWIGKGSVAAGNEHVAGSLAVVYNADDGYIRDLGNGNRLGRTRDFAGRAKLNVNPTEDVELRFTAGYVKNRESTGEAYRPFNRSTIGARVPGNLYGVEPFTSALSFLPYNNLQSSNFAGTLILHLGAFDVTSVTGWQKNDLAILADSDGTRANIASIGYQQHSRDMYHETYFTSNFEGPLSVIGGVVYFHEKASTDNFSNISRTVSATGVIGAPSTLTLVGIGHTDSYAGYLQGTYKFPGDVSLTVGGRYTHEERDVRITSTANLLPNAKTFTKFTPSATLQYTPSDALNIYAKAGKAFKAGIFNLSATSQAATAPVNPEVLTQYEVGMKARITPVVQLNVAAYYSDYKNLQSPARNAIGQSFLQNAGAAHIYGGEAELLWRPLDGLNVRAGLSLLHGEYKNFPNSQVNITATTGDAAAPSTCFVNPGAPTGGNRITICDVSGRKIIRTPFLQGNVGGDYTVPVGAGEVTISGNVYYSGHSYWETLNLFKEPSYVLASGEISWKPTERDLRVAIWGDNLFNEVYSLTLSASGTATSQVLAKPRTYGVKVSYGF